MAVKAKEKPTATVSSAAKDAKPRAKPNSSSGTVSAYKLEKIGPYHVSRNVRLFLSAVIALACAVIFAWLLDYPMNGVLKFVAALGLLGVTGDALRRLLHLEGDWGLILLRTQKGLITMDKLSRWKPGLWRFLADFGTAFGFGALSIFMYRDISKKAYVAGLLAILVSSYVVLPFILPVAFSVISNLPAGSLSRSGEGGASAEMTTYFYLGLLLLGGVAIAGIMGLVVNAATILVAIASYAAGASNALASASPGAAPIIPGKNIPLFEGLAALVIILIVHESAHGILARLHKIKLKSAGVVLYGILPVGAFVDPDEETLFSSKPHMQREVLVGGSTANFLTCFASFAMLMLFFAATAPMQDNSVYASAFLNGTKVVDNTKIVEMNKRAISAPSDVLDALSAGTSNLISMRTADGRLLNARLAPADGSIESLNYAVISCQEIECESFSYAKQAGDSTRLSVLFQNSRGEPFVPMGSRVSGSFIYPNAFLPGYEWLGFVYGVLALSFVLNFLIGSVNLMPIPMFDGHRLFGLAVRNETMMKIITYGVSLAFLLNLAPWIWA